VRQIVSANPGLGMPPPLRAAARFGLSYRPLRAEDFDFTEALYLSTRAAEMAITGWPEEHKRQFLVEQHQAQHDYYQAHYSGAEWLIVEHLSEPIGRLYLAKWEAEVRIIDISLVERARSRGWGGAIIEDVIEWARTSGKPTSIHVEKNNPARRLYSRLGFLVAVDKGIYDLMQCG
jgi:GNAT superfamily N-acetyltransferase